MYLLSLLLLHIISFLDVKKNITITSIKSKVMDHQYIYLYISTCTDNDNTVQILKKYKAGYLYSSNSLPSPYSSAPPFFRSASPGYVILRGITHPTLTISYIPGGR